MVPVTSKYNHLVTSFGLKMMTPVFDLMQQLIDAGVTSGQKFSVDPRPLDGNVPANLLQKLIFKGVYGRRRRDLKPCLLDIGECFVVISVGIDHISHKNKGFAVYFYSARHSVAPACPVARDLTGELIGKRPY